MGASLQTKVYQRRRERKGEEGRGREQNIKPHHQPLNTTHWVH